MCYNITIIWILPLRNGINQNQFWQDKSDEVKPKPTFTRGNLKSGIRDQKHALESRGQIKWYLKMKLICVKWRKDRNGCRLAKERGSRMIATNTGGQRLTFYWIEFWCVGNIKLFNRAKWKSNESEKFCLYYWEGRGLTTSLKRKLRPWLLVEFQS